MEFIDTLYSLYHKTYSSKKSGVELNKYYFTMATFNFEVKNKFSATSWQTHKEYKLIKNTKRTQTSEKNNS